MTFDALPLDPRLAPALEAAGFVTPTPIQAAAIPPMAEGRDLIGRARTGSGKALAFILPVLSREQRALILAPTRELAAQTAEAAKPFVQAMGETVALIHGGVAYEPQIRALKKARLIVATPGRLIDLLQRGSAVLSRTHIVVLDEADEMLRLGFIDDVTTLLEACPENRQIALFSATMPKQIRAIANRFQTDAVEIQVESKGMTVDHIEQMWMRVPNAHRLEALIRVLRGKSDGATLVFARTRAECASMADALAQRGVAADALHGDLNQGARERLVKRLRAKRLDVVIATDIAARGLDVEHITHVVNLELPRDTEIYVHRIGRTGRVGRKGTAITFCTPRQVRRIYAFAKQLGVEVPQVDVPGDAEVQAHMKTRLTRELELAEDHEHHAMSVAWVAELVEKGWTPERVAAAALQRLAQTQGGLEGGDKIAPEWSRKVRNDGPEQRTGSNEAEIFVPIGKHQGVRAGDLVGAIANEAGIPGSRIGRISIFPRKSFVGLSKEDAESLLNSHKTIQIRGNDVPLSRSRGKGSAPPGRDGDRPRGKSGGRPGGRPGGDRRDDGDRPGRRGPPQKKWGKKPWSKNKTRGRG